MTSDQLPDSHHVNIHTQAFDSETSAAEVLSGEKCSHNGWFTVRTNLVSIFCLGVVCLLGLTVAAGGLWLMCQPGFFDSATAPSAASRYIIWAICFLIVTATSVSHCRAAYDLAATSQMNLRATLQAVLSPSAHLLVTLCALALVSSLVVPIVGPAVAGAWTFAVMPSYFRLNTSGWSAVQEATTIFRCHGRGLVSITFRRYLTIMSAFVGFMMVGTVLASFLDLSRFPALGVTASTTIVATWAFAFTSLVGASDIYLAICGITTLYEHDCDEQMRLEDMLAAENDFETDMGHHQSPPEAAHPDLDND